MLYLTNERFSVIRGYRLVLVCLLVVSKISAVPTGHVQAADQTEIQLLGTIRFDGTMQDQSEDASPLENGQLGNRFGGISAIEYSGNANLFYAIADRGPDDGAAGYMCRFHLLKLDINPLAIEPVQGTVVKTVFLSDHREQVFSGSAALLCPTDTLAGRFDPEAVRSMPDGSLYVSDEYGPQLIQFGGDGRERCRVPLPSVLSVKVPADSKDRENQLNQSGRSSNRGMEGLALSTDGRHLYGLMQGALLQDSLRDEPGHASGRHCRLVEVDIDSGKCRQFVYSLEHPAYGTNEILAIGPDEFLVIERDSQPGTEAGFRKLMRIQLDNATDVSDRLQLASSTMPADTLDPSVIPVDKEVFLDFLNPKFGLVGEGMPEKIEGLTLGPVLPDGRHTLLVAIDNDFEEDHPTLIWVFAVPTSGLPALTSAALSSH